MSIHTLSYPVYVAAFDPYNSDFLFVGGGGGEGRSGVPNKISLLDTSAAPFQELREVAHIDLSRDEDSVSSLAVAQASEKEATVFAGINSSQQEQDAGNNEHLRAIKIPYPQRKPSSSGTTTKQIPAPSALSKASVFSPSKDGPKETYQRVLRLSPASKTSKKRLGAIATGLAPEGEVIFFDASKPTPSASDVLKRISVGKKEEVGDVDIVKTGDLSYRAVYCTDANVFCVDVNLKGKATVSEPFKVFNGSKVDGSFRSLRLLTKNLALLVRNFPRRRGAQILIVNVPNEPYEGKVVYGSALPTGFNAATALDVASLPSTDQSDRKQFLIAVSGQDGSIVLQTFDYTPTQARKLLLKKHSVFRDIHPAGITHLAFSKHLPTPLEVPDKPLRIKLASTSFGNTVVVQVFPLKPVLKSKKATHHVLASPPQATGWTTMSQIFVGAFFIALVSIALGAYAELSGKAKYQPLGIRNWAPGPVKELFGAPSEVAAPLASAPVIVDKMPNLEPEAVARAASRKADKEASKATSAVQEAVTPAVEALQDIIDASTESVDQHLQKLSEEAATALHAPVSAVDEILQHIPEAPTQAAADAAEQVQEVGQEESKAAAEKIQAALSANQESSSGAVMFRDLAGGLGVTTHEHESHAEEAGAKKWEDLSTPQRRLWTARLKQAGHWVEGETETVLKGVFFGTIAGLVGAAAQG